MKAMLMKETGAPLVFSEVADPVPGPREILVKLYAAGVNPLDAKLRSKGTFYSGPSILGAEGAGVVANTGKEVSRFKAGDEVFFLEGGLGGASGNYAEYIAVHEDYAAAKPPSLSMTEAAALPLAFITAWESLFERANLCADQTVLIHAGGGGVGHFALQLAKYCGAKVATTVSAAKAAFAAELGADFVIDYQTTDFVAEILDWTAGRGVDVVFDTVGGEIFARSLAVSSLYGKAVTLHEPPFPPDALKAAKRKNLSIHYELMLTPQLHSLHDRRFAQRTMLESAAEMIKAGKLTVKLSAKLPLSRANEAHELIESGRTLGKIAIEI